MDQPDVHCRGDQHWQICNNVFFFFELLLTSMDCYGLIWTDITFSFSLPVDQRQWHGVLIDTGSLTFFQSSRIHRFYFGVIGLYTISTDSISAWSVYDGCTCVEWARRTDRRPRLYAVAWRIRRPMFGGDRIGDPTRRSGSLPVLTRWCLKLKGLVVEFEGRHEENS